MRPLPGGSGVQSARIDPDEPPLLDIERCYDCRLCLPACPFGAVIHLNGERR